MPWYPTVGIGSPAIRGGSKSSEGSFSMRKRLSPLCRFAGSGSVLARTGRRWARLPKGHHGLAPALRNRSPSRRARAARPPWAPCLRLEDQRQVVQADASGFSRKDQPKVAQRCHLLDDLIGDILLLPIEYIGDGEHLFRHEIPDRPAKLLMKFAQHHSPPLLLLSTGASIPRRTAPIKIATGTLTSAPVASDDRVKGSNGRPRGGRCR